jgi:hypothetical protein
MSVVVKVADERHGAAGVEQPLSDFGDRLRGLRSIHRDPYEFGSRFGEFLALTRRGRRIGGVGHRHALDDHWRATTDLNMADAHADGAVQADRYRGCGHRS